MIKCCRCDRKVVESSTRIDEWLKKPACKICRLKLEIMSSPSLHFGIDLSTGETFSIRYLWDEKTSKVLNEECGCGETADTPGSEPGAR